MRTRREGLVTMYVASETRMKTLVPDYACYGVRFHPNDPWVVAPDLIMEFEHKSGVEYELLVERVRMENPPEDFLAWHTLVKGVYAVEKQSKNLPE